MPKEQMQSIWQSILETAKTEDYPLEKKRGLIREYLQSKFLYYLYDQKQSKSLAFIGGTALRLLHNLDRFSEDLDFDNLGLGKKQLELTIAKAANFVKKSGFDLEIKNNLKNQIGTIYLKFGAGLLKNISASLDAKEKLHIKIDIKKPEAGTETEVYLLTKFDSLQNIVSNNLETLLSQKTLAFLYRKSPRGRDIYDIVWLLSKNIKPNLKCLKKVKINNINDYLNALNKKYNSLRPKIKNLKNQLRPFLVDENKIKYLDMLPKLIETLRFKIK